MKEKFSGHKKNYMDKLSDRRRSAGMIGEDRRGWLRKGRLKRTTEALIMATHEQVIRTNNKSKD